MKRGDRIRLTKDSRDIRFPETFRKGEVGALGQLYRVQDGVEIWEVILDMKKSFGLGEANVRIAVVATHLEVL